MNRPKHRITKYRGDKKIHKAIDNHFLTSLKNVAKSLNEVELV